MENLGLKKEFIGLLRKKDREINLLFNAKMTIFLVLLISFFSFTMLDQQIMAEPSTLTEVAKNDGPLSFRPQIAVDENNVYLVWTVSDGVNDEIFFSKSNNGGASFESPLNLSNNSGPSSFPRITVSGNDIFVVWYDYTPGKSDIFIAKSIDDGETFETTNLSNNVGPSFNPWIYADVDEVFVVWNDGTRDLVNVFGENAKDVDLGGRDVSFGDTDVLFAVSHDGGDNFKIFDIGDPAMESWNQRMMVHDDKVYVVWNGRTNDVVDIYFSVSTDGGFSFTEPSNVSRSENSSKDAGLAAWENNIYLIWKETDSKGTDIFYSKTTDDGISFTEPIGIGKIPHAAINRDAEISAINDNVYVVWYEDTPEGDVYFVKSSDSGEHFERPISLDVSDGTSKFAQVTAYENQVYVIWNNNGTGNWDVLFRASYDEGSTFGGIRNISNDENDSHIIILGPQIAVNEQGVFTVFENQTKYRDGNIFLDKFIPDTPQDGNLALQLENNNGVRVQVNFDSAQIHTDKEVSFSLMFFDSVSGKPISDVNYSIMIKDSEDSAILDESSQFSKDGKSSHTVQFSETGPVNVFIDIEGTGTKIPYDVSYSGMTGFVITAVSGFDYSILLVLGIVALVLIIVLALKFSKESKNN